MSTGVETIHLIHHSHTDIGYTHDQPIVWDLHRRFIDTAIQQCQLNDDGDADHTFRWTVETTAMLDHWLESANDTQIERFLELVKAGRIEVTAMALNVTPLYDTDQLIEALRPVQRLRKDYRIPIRHAMQSDVNGQNWPLVDVLLDAGIEGFSMATNIHYGGSPLAWPNAFQWQGPSGRTLPAWNGWDYAFAQECGIGEDAGAFRDTWWPRLQRWLDEREYPLPCLMMQMYDRFGDNGPAAPALSEFVQRWNDAGNLPRLRISTPTDWWNAVRASGVELPVHRGDWTDFWNFGAGSSAREIAINRASKARLRTADVFDLADRSDDPVCHAAPGTRGRAWRAVDLFDEHTWGADGAIHRPNDEDTASQWHHKAITAYEGRSLSLMLQRDAVANLAATVAHDDDDVAVVVNPLPWDISFRGPVAATSPDQLRGRPDDPTSARHTMDRDHLRLPDPHTSPVLKTPVIVPALGWTVISRAQLNSTEPDLRSDELIRTAHHEIRFDLERGGIASWALPGIVENIVGTDFPYPFGVVSHQEPIQTEGLDNPRYAFWSPVERRLGLKRGWRPGWPSNTTWPLAVSTHEVTERADGAHVRQIMPLITGETLTADTFLPVDAPWIEIELAWDMTMRTYPEATLVPFPVAMPDARITYDLGHQAVRLVDDQLPRACRDYVTAQNWIDVSNDHWGLTVACPDAPLFMTSGFSFGAGRETDVPNQQHLVGWPTNSYWETNFRAHQPGRIQVRYRLLPHAGTLDEMTAHRFGMEARYQPVQHHLFETVSHTAGRRPMGSLLRLPNGPIFPIHLEGAEGKILLRLINASDDDQTATIGSAELKIGTAVRISGTGDDVSSIDTTNGELRLSLGPREIQTVRLEIVE